LGHAILVHCPKSQDATHGERTSGCIRILKAEVKLGLNRACSSDAPHSKSLWVDGERFMVEIVSFSEVQEAR
jgi:hypothetical protein